MIKQDFVATKPLMVARSKVESLFPGLNGKTLANQLSEGRGPKAYRVGRKIFYRVEELEAYLTERPIQTVQSPSQKKRVCREKFSSNNRVAGA